MSTRVKAWLRRLAAAAFLALTFAALFGLIAPVAGLGAASTGKTRVFQIDSERFQYSPARIKANKGDHIYIRLTSSDVTHGLYLDGYEMKMDAEPAGMGQMHFIADKAGVFRFRCSKTCGPFHPFMIGQLEVSPNSPYQASIALTLLAGLGALGFVALYGHKLIPGGQGE